MVAPRAALGALAFALSTTPALEGAADARVGAAEQAITHGSSSDGDPAVVGLLYPLGDERLLWCTGTLVAPRWVVTAGHCVEPSRPVAVAVGSSMTDAIQVPVCDAIPHHQFDPKTLTKDVAMIELCTPAPLLPIALAGDEEGAEVGQQVALVGFGRADDAGPPLKRRGTARVAHSDSGVLHLEPDPSLTCTGDSGGPALARTDRGEVLVGVASSGDWECAETSSHTDILAVDEFVRSVMRPAATSGCTAGTSPPTRISAAFSAFAALVALLAARRRSKRTPAS